MPRRMRGGDATGIGSLYRLCHPTWPERSAAWFASVNTLVIREKGHILGFTSGSITLAPLSQLNQGSEFVMFGHDVCVHPDVRGRGIGRALCEARLALARAAGARTFIGCTWTENAPMIRIFERQGLKPYGIMPQGFPHNNPPVDGVIYIGGLL